MVSLEMPFVDAADHEIASGTKGVDEATDRIPLLILDEIYAMMSMAFARSVGGSTSAKGMASGETSCLWRDEAKL